MNEVPFAAQGVLLVITAFGSRAFPPRRVAPGKGVQIIDADASYEYTRDSKLGAPSARAS